MPPVFSTSLIFLSPSRGTIPITQLTFSKWNLVAFTVVRNTRFTQLEKVPVTRRAHLACTRWVFAALCPAAVPSRLPSTSVGWPLLDVHIKGITEHVALCVWSPPRANRFRGTSALHPVGTLVLSMLSEAPRRSTCCPPSSSDGRWCLHLWSSRTHSVPVSGWTQSAFLLAPAASLLQFLRKPNVPAPGSAPSSLGSSLYVLLRDFLVRLLAFFL